MNAVIMNTVALFDAKNRFSELIDRASKGEEIVITRRGLAVARLVGPKVEDPESQVRALAERIRRTRLGHDLGGAGASIRAMGEEGRR